MDLNNNRYYLAWFKNSWNYVTGAIIISLLQILTMAVTGEPFKITSAFVYWAGWLLKALGVNVSNWQIFSSIEAQETLESGFLFHTLSIRTIGIIVGALLASIMASQFKIRRIKSHKQLFAAILGGLLMGYGSKIALGCNIGALFGGISSLSLSGWIFLIFLFLGGIIGSKLLLRFLM